MIGILASQLESIYVLAEVLKSRGIMDDDDLHAFWSIRPHAARKDAVERAHRLYYVLAETVGIDTAAEGLSPT